MSLQQPEMEFVESVEASAQVFERAQQAATTDSIEAAMEAFKAAERERGGGFIASQTVKEKRAFLERQAQDALQAAARQYQDNRSAALKTIALVEQVSETLPSEVDSLGNASADLRYAARTAQALEEQNLRASLDGVSAAELVDVYKRAVERKDRPALRFLEAAHANGFRGVNVATGPDDANAVLQLTQAIKAERKTRHPAWTTAARERLAQKASTESLLRLVTQGHTAIA